MDPTGCTIQSDGIGEHVTPPITAVGLSPRHYADDHDGGDSSQLIWRENKDYADVRNTMLTDNILFTLPYNISLAKYKQTVW
jgi:hypothetical protein